VAAAGPADRHLREIRSGKAKSKVGRPLTGAPFLPGDGMRKFLLVALFSTLVVARPAVAATVDGIDIHWTSAGSGAQTIVFVHGWTCDESSWQGQVPELSRRFRVITLDLPGHGKSGSPKDGKFSMALFARAVEAVRADAKVERAVFAGHSMGTPVIRQYALMHPKRVAGLVLVDGLVQVAGAAPPFTPPAMVGEAGLKARESMVRGMFGPATTPALQEHILKMMLGTKEATATGAMTATWDSSWVTNDAIRVPTLAVYAERGIASVENIKRIFPSVEYHRMPGTAHFLMMEKPQEFNALVTDFVGRLKR
jgi:pimeloyl-ACP methyl ester carboxylesterase